MRSLRNALLGSITACGVGLLAAAPAQADLFNLTSCHLSGGCGTATQFGTVTLGQSGANVTVDVVLNPGNLFIETGAGGHNLFDFNDTLAGTTVTNMSVTFNGATVTEPGGLTGETNVAPFMADGTGMFTADVHCTNSADCNGGSGASINDLHFTVTNITLAQLETRNAAGNFFVADILCGQAGCPSGGPTGPVDASVAVPGPTAGAGLPGLALAGFGLFLGWRRRRRAVA